MDEIAAAVLALLSPIRPAYFVTVPTGHPSAYFTVWGSGGAPDERVLSGDADGLSTTLGVTSVAATPEGVLTIQRQARAVLSPNGGSVQLVTPAWLAWLRLSDSRPVDVDRDATIEGTDLHPAFGVDVYTVTATPL